MCLSIPKCMATFGISWIMIRVKNTQMFRKILEKCNCENGIIITSLYKKISWHEFQRKKRQFYITLSLFKRVQKHLFYWRFHLKHGLIFIVNGWDLKGIISNHLQPCSRKLYVNSITHLWDMAKFVQGIICKGPLI